MRHICRGPAGVGDENYRKCGKPNCACAQPDHRGHGPRFLWNAVGGAPEDGRAAARRRPRWRSLSTGSGVVEASCKTIVGQRLKQAGMHWTVNGADAMIALRCREAGSPVGSHLRPPSQPDRSRLAADGTVRMPMAKQAWATSSACPSTSSASPGWSTSPSSRPSPENLRCRSQRPHRCTPGPAAGRGRARGGRDDQDHGEGRPAAGSRGRARRLRRVRRRGPGGGRRCYRARDRVPSADRPAGQRGRHGQLRRP